MSGSQQLSLCQGDMGKARETYSYRSQEKVRGTGRTATPRVPLLVKTYKITKGGLQAK